MGGTHILLKIVSKDFDGLNLVAQHRKVYDILDSVIKEKNIHAITLKLKKEESK